MPPNENYDSLFSYNSANLPLRPPDRPRNNLQLNDQSGNRQNVRQSPKKRVEIFDDAPKRLGMHKKSKSVVSLKSLMGSDRPKALNAQHGEDLEAPKLKSPKSSTGLSALLSPKKNFKASKKADHCQKKDKENQTPPPTASAVPPPIWAQYATQGVVENVRSMKVPLKDHDDIDDETKSHLYKDHSPVKQQQKNRGDTEAKCRPQSEVITPSQSKTSFIETLSALRKHRSREAPRAEQEEYLEKRPSKSNEIEKVSSSGINLMTGKVTTKHRDNFAAVIDSSASSERRGTRVMAAVAALNGNAMQMASDSPKRVIERTLDAKEVDCEFENLLETRNIPQNLRERMRSLTIDIKADFVKKNKTVLGSVSSIESRASAAVDAPSTGRPAIAQRSKTDHGTCLVDAETTKNVDDTESPKKRRPRSRTFTFSKGDSPTKRQKADNAKPRGRSKSRDRKSAEVARSNTPDTTSRSSLFNRTPKPAIPDTFVSYLRTTVKPETVENEKMHKLRQLLRNETIEWVDQFIEKGGMTELIELLYRILKVEWREEHEDTLLHETLLCIKALSTASRALEYLSMVESTLFPTLIAMLFDEERKGPSEYITRNIVISLLFIHLCNSTSAESVTRARTMLSYLRDPSKSEASQLPGFITSMHHSRPYRFWCKEVVNVTKEVFWIFIHKANLIPYPVSTEQEQSYRAAHFPRQRPPVPAAPYIGGVEWDATNYIATHLDLLNGLVASLPSREERNNLRQELKDSGLEKCMGYSLRTCKEKFYGYVHDGLATWVGAAMADGWPITEVREGPMKDEVVRQSPRKTKREAPPKLEMPRLDLGLAGVKGEDEGWL